MTTSPKDPPARLALADGSVFHGSAFGDLRPQTTGGEVCFNTSLCGYQEILTDPSYAGQIVAMTYPLIGNYGVNETDMESIKPHARGFVVREVATRPSNYRSTEGLPQWLARAGVIGISGIDTRALTRKIRTRGVLNGVLSTDTTLPDEALVARARSVPGLIGINLVEGVSIRQPTRWAENLAGWDPLHGRTQPATRRNHVAVLDCGSKLNIFRHLVECGCQVTVLPFDVRPEQVLEHEPDGLFVSNGPGDPAAVEPTIRHLTQLVGKIPIFGICLGHQLLSLALGATTFKLPFGHRGANQPVQNLYTKKVEITSQNHGFAVETPTLERVGGDPTHINLNDGTLEGFRHQDHPILAVQYHPEASPGPHDARYLFDCFVDMMRSGRSPTGEQMDQAQRRRNQILQRT